MTVVPEVLIFKAADEAEANKTLQEHYKSSNGGITKSYKGFTEEKPDTVVAVNLWAANPPATASTSSTYISHPALDAPDQLQLVLDSKVMEIVLISLKPEYDPVQVVGKLIERARAHEKTSGTTWGQDAKNGDDHFVAMLGWESSKEHFEVVGQGDFVPMINQFKESGKEITMYHVPLKESKLGA